MKYLKYVAPALIAVCLGCNYVIDPGPPPSHVVAERCRAGCTVVFKGDPVMVHQYLPHIQRERILPDTPRLIPIPPEHPLNAGVALLADHILLAATLEKHPSAVVFGS
jgi:hypothetical protein